MEYHDRLLNALRIWRGIDTEYADHLPLLRGFFKDQSTPDVKRVLAAKPGYPGKPREEILPLAAHAFNSQEEQRKRDSKKNEEDTKVLALSL